MTEFFGPVLAVLRADSLEHAIAMVNQTGYGLTSGLQSLDLREQEVWRESLRAGNLYINRGTTGAIVLRQPFGGMGKSAFGPGIKAGGPNYVAQLMRFVDRADALEPDSPDEVPERVSQLQESLAVLKTESFLDAESVRWLSRAIRSYASAMEREFGVEHDSFRLVGQDNIRRYLPVPFLRVRLHPEDSNRDIVARICAAMTVGGRVTVSRPEGCAGELCQRLDALTVSWGGDIEFVVESDAELAASISTRATDRVRYSSRERVPLEVRKAVGDTGVYIADTPVVAEGRLELLWYCMEQSISTDYHRYGNLGARTGEERAPIPAPEGR